MLNWALCANTMQPILIASLIPITVLSALGIPAQKLTSPLAEERLVAQKELNLQNRWPNSFVNEVFKDNILLNLAYMEGRISPTQKPNWDEVRKPSQFEFRLEPNQTFAYHDDVLAKYQAQVVKTTNAHFNAADGFKTDGYLFGDGVCHLASLLYWVSKDAGLEAEAPTNHNFMAIQDIPKAYGVSIYSNPYTKGSHARQNLYITNNKNKPISFKFEYDGEKVKLFLRGL